MFFKIIFYILLFVVGLLIFSTLIFFWWNSYDDSVLLILKYFNKVEKLNDFKNQYLTLSTFYSIRILLFISSAFWLVCFYLFKRYYEIVYRYSKIVIDKFKKLYFVFVDGYNSLDKNEKILLASWFIIFLVSRLYFISKFPLHIDEAFSFVFIVSKGMGVTLTYYPGPNNHIAYLILCNLSDIIFNDPIWIMRFPVLIISLVTSVFIFGIGKKYIGFYPSFIGLSLFSFSEFGIFYSTHGRGYYLMIFCVIVALESLVKYLQYQINNSNENTSGIISKSMFYQMIFILSCSIGFFTIPVFLYPYISFLIIWILFLLYKKKYDDSKKIIYSSSLTVVITLVFYTPVLTVSGLSSIVGNSWVKSLDFYSFIEEYFNYLLDTHSTFYTLEKWGAIFTFLFLLVALFLFFSRKATERNKKLAIVGLSMVLVPLMLIIFQRVLPFSRVWIYKSLFEYLFLGLGFYYLFKKFIENKNYRIVILIMFLFSHSFVLSKYWIDEINDPKNIYNQFPKLIELIDKLQSKKMFVNHDVYNVFMRYDYLIDSKNIDISVMNYNEKEDYDLLITNKKKQMPEKLFLNKYIEFYQDDFVIAYKRK